MNIAEACIKNNRTSVVVFALIIVLGVWTYVHIPRLEDPLFTIRTAVVVTYFPGASPSKVENLVTDKLEENIREMAEVKRVRSQSMSGVSVLHVRVEDEYKDMTPIWQNLRNKVSDTEPELPEGVYTPIVNDEFGDVYGILLALTGDGYTYKEMEEAAEDIRDRFMELEDVSKVELHGIQEERIFIEFSNARMAELGFSPQQLMQILRSQNAIQPSGNARLGSERVIIESTGEFKSLEQIRTTTLRLPGRSQSVYLGDIAEIYREYADPPRHIVKYKNKKSLVIAISMKDDGNIVKLGEKVDDSVSHITKDLPIGLELHKLMYQPKFVSRSIHDFSVNLLEAFGFVVLVMLLFVGLKTGIIAGSLVPMAVLSSLMLMPLFNVQLQIVSIGALIISLGILVDNGVVVSENILVNISAGHDRLQACRQGIKRLWLPLLTASLTTIFAFLPIPLADSMTGEYTVSLFTVVTLTLLSSWVLALTFVPMLYYCIIKRSKRGGRNLNHFFYRLYRGLLIFCLKYRAAFLVLVLGSIGLSVWGFSYVPKIFFPPNEREILTIDFWQPYGTDIRSTANRAENLEKFLLDQKEVESTGVFIGYGGPRWYLAMEPKQSNPNYAFFVVNTKSKQVLSRLKEKIDQEIGRAYPDCRASVRMLERGPPVGAPIQIRIKGDEQKVLYRLRDKVVGLLKELPSTKNVWDDWGEWTKKIIVDVNQEKAKRAGLSTKEIALSLQAQFSGLEVTQYREEENLIPIVARSQKNFREDLWKIESINVYSYAQKQSVPLMHVADLKINWQPSNIRRRNGIRTMTVKADIKEGIYASNILNNEIAPALAKMQREKDWPIGYELEYGGESEESSTANKSILINVPFAMGLILLILVMQFNSVRRVLIIALTIPPMFVGVTGGMLLTNSPFGFMALLGIISLVGIIVNNAIMMIDQIEVEREQSESIQKALVLAAQKRLRPILMTASTTILGLVPLSLQGGELWSPMANALIFGLAFSTLLTLLLCPVLYSLFFRLNYKGYFWHQAEE